MTTYATFSDLAAFCVAFDLITYPGDPKAFPLIGAAERDVDRALNPHGTPLPTGLRYDPLLLTAAQRAALSRATCAQAVHRLILGEDYFSEPEDITTGELRILRPARSISNRVFEEVAGHDLYRRTGTVPPAA